MKFQVPIPLPRRADGTRLPAALTALLALLFVAQLALPAPVELPEVAFGRPLRLRPLEIVRTVADPAIVARPLFAPGRREFVNPGVADKAAPLEGARAVGIVSVNGAVRVFLQALDGRTQAVGRGGRYRGWTVVDIGQGQIIVRRGAERAMLAVTASAPPLPPRPAADGNPEDDPQ